MKKFFYLFTFALFLPVMLTAQENAQKDSTLGWHFFNTGTLSFTQSSFTNWATGGENSLAMNGMVLSGFNYKSNEYIWDNGLLMAYGMQKQGDKELRKTTDKLEFNSKYGYHAIKNWYYSALVGFMTQFDRGYKYDDDAGTKTLISNFMAPAYINIALGMNYKPSKEFSLFIGPLSGRTTVVNDTSLSINYGLDPGDKTRNEFGGSVKANLNKNIMKNVNLVSQLVLFSNYVENPQNIDVDLQMLFTMKINKFLTATLNLQFIYDDDIMITDTDGNTGPRLQVKEIFGLGLSYKISN